MPVSVDIQVYIFLYSLVGGMAIAFVFDLFRIKRKAVNSRTISIYFEDFLFWIIVAMLMLIIIYKSNEGEVRGYIFIGTILGLILYIMLLSKIVMHVFLTILHWLAKLIRILWIILTYPLKLIYKILRVPGRILWSWSRKQYRKARVTGRNRLSRAVLWKKIFKNARKKI